MDDSKRAFWLFSWETEADWLAGRLGGNVVSGCVVAVEYVVITSLNRVISVLIKTKILFLNRVVVLLVLFASDLI